MPLTLCQDTLKYTLAHWCLEPTLWDTPVGGGCGNANFNPSEEMPSKLRILNWLDTSFVPHTGATMFLVDCTDLSDKYETIHGTELQRDWNKHVLCSQCAEVHTKLQIFRRAAITFISCPCESSPVAHNTNKSTGFHTLQSGVTADLIARHANGLCLKQRTRPLLMLCAQSLTDTENIDLSDLNLDYVPHSLKTLTCRTLDLSSNNLQKIPKWLAASPNVRLGRGDRWTLCKKGEADFRHFTPNKTHKLVIVGDMGVGKKKLTKAKHVQHTGIAIHYDVMFKYNQLDCLGPWSVFIIVFDVSFVFFMQLSNGKGW
ncbi:hypothetical protein Pelo_1887 [Pelomyxa schiedti]|nr:hypothetical protein Pelo_1887 [Pelomyxa schiedti]